jgi:hypothetical protein
LTTRTGRVIVILNVRHNNNLVDRSELRRTDTLALRFCDPFPPLVIFGLISTPSGILCNSLTKAVVLPPTSTKSIVAGKPSG